MAWGAIVRDALKFALGGWWRLLGHGRPGAGGPYGPVGKVGAGSLG